MQYATRGASIRFGGLRYATTHVVYTPCESSERRFVGIGQMNGDEIQTAPAQVVTHSPRTRYVLFAVTWNMAERTPTVWQTTTGFLVYVASMSELILVFNLSWRQAHIQSWYQYSSHVSLLQLQ